MHSNLALVGHSTKLPGHTAAKNLFINHQESDNLEQMDDINP